MKGQTKQVPEPLKKTREHFERWRRKGKKKKAIPEKLWEEAVGHCERYGTSPTAKTLCLNQSKLKKRKEASKGKNLSPFVELMAKENVNIKPEIKSECHIEVEGADGKEIKINLIGEATEKVIEVLDALQRRSK